MNDMMRNELHYLATSRRTINPMAFVPIKNAPAVNSGHRSMARKMGLSYLREWLVTRSSTIVLTRLYNEMKRLYAEGFTFREIDEEMFGVEPESTNDEVAYHLMPRS